MVLSDTRETALTEQVSLWEDPRILKFVDRVANSKGSNRSVVIREAIRFFLGCKSYLTVEEKKDLETTPNP